jgi:hypothetical protein
MLKMMDFRSKPGFTSSSPRMFMFGITTFTFVLGIIELVLSLSVEFQQGQLFLNRSDQNVWSSYKTNVILAVAATIERLMVRLRDAFIRPARLNLLLSSIF